LLQLVFDLLDHVAGGGVMLSEAARRRSKEVRAEIEAKKLRALQVAHQQEREWKRREKQRKEEEALARSTPEAKRKKEEKEMKKKRRDAEKSRWPKTRIS
jgi:iron-sulfur cluster repair protein YtfE (RIC family)